MNIYYEFVINASSFFTNESGERVEYKDIKDNYYKLDGRKGKLVHMGYTGIYEQGYIGGYDNFGFVFQDDLSLIRLNKNGKILLEYVD